MASLDEFRIDRTAFEVGDLTDRLSDRDHWLSKTAGERLEALEMVRMMAYGYDPDTQRLQRVLEVAPRKRR